MSSALQIEKERDEHLMPRLNASPEPEPEPEMIIEHEPVHEIHDRPASPESISSESDHEPEPVPPPREVPAHPVKMQPTMRPLEVANSIPSLSSPDISDTGSLGIGMSLSGAEDSTSQNFIGPSTKADQQKAKLGFGGLKLGRLTTLWHSLIDKKLIRIIIY